MTFAGLILFWKTNAWFRWLCLAGALFAAWFVFKEHYKAEGRKEGIEQATDEISTSNKKQWEQIRQDFQVSNAQFQAKIDSLTSQVEAYRETSRLLATQKQQASQQVAGMTPAQLREVLNAFLGRPAQDSSPYTAEDERKLAQCTTQWPICERQRETLDKENVSLRDTIDVKDQQYALLGNYTSRVEDAYANEYNNNRHKKRAPKCLWLWRCGVEKIDQQHLPNLLKERPSKP